MFPVLIEIGGHKILYTFGVLVLAGVLVGLHFIKKDASRVGLDPDDTISLATEVFIAGLIGSRIFFVVMNWEQMYAHASWFAVFNLREGGLVWYGGLLAAVPVAIWRSWAYGFPIAKVCDLFAAPVMLGLSIGRIGCLMAGDDHGKIWDHATWFTLTFTNPNALMDPNYLNKPLLPSQPLMSMGAFLIFCTLWSLRKRLYLQRGAISALLFVLYPIHRFLVELTRGDKIRGYLPEDIPIVGGMATSQALSVPLVLCGVGLFIYFAFIRAPADPDPVKAAGADAPAPADAEAPPPADAEAPAPTGDAPDEAPDPDATLGPETLAAERAGEGPSPS